MGDGDGDGVERRSQDDGRCVIGTAFELLDHVGALQPVRLLDLAEATGIPGPTVHRLLKQLIEVGAVGREGTRYRLGVSLLELGAQVTPEHRLRAVARRPLAELAAATGAAVGLSARIGRRGSVPGHHRCSRSARATRTGQPGTAGNGPSAYTHRDRLPSTDCGRRWLPGTHQLRRCSGSPGKGAVAAVTTLVAGQRPSPGLSAATRAAGTRIAALVNAPARTIDDSRQNSTQWKMGGR
jgi:hypothetical protein